MRDPIAPPDALSGANQRHLTVAELLSRLAADEQASGARAHRSAPDQVLSVEQLLRREGRSAALVRSAGDPMAPRHSVPPVPPPQHGTVPDASSPAQHCAELHADRHPDVDAARPSAPARPRLRLVPPVAVSEARHAVSSVSIDTLNIDTLGVDPGAVDTLDVLGSAFGPDEFGSAPPTRSSRSRRSGMRRLRLVDPLI